MIDAPNTNAADVKMIKVILSARKSEEAAEAARVAASQNAQGTKEVPTR